MCRRMGRIAILLKRIRLPKYHLKRKKKERDRELPDWMLDKTTVNELIFSRMFLGQHPMKCIKGVFYDYDGVVDENELGN